MKGRIAPTAMDPATVHAALDTLARDADAMACLYRTAEAHARVSAAAAQELVWDVIGGMAAGDVMCSSEASLVTQLTSEVRRRAKRLCRANRRERDPARSRFVPLEMAPESALAIEPEQSYDHDESSAPDPADLVATIRELARDDDAVQRLIALYERELVSRRQVLDAGMTEWVHRAARERLTTYGAMALSAVPATLLSARQRRAVESLRSTVAIGPNRRAKRTRRATVRQVGLQAVSISV